jgi:hypothetical protein
MEKEHPVLEAFKSIPNTPEVQDWAESAAQKVQAFANVRAIADGATAAGNEYVQNIDNFKSGLVRMAHSDPTTLPLALDLVPDAINTMVGEDGAEHAAALTRHIQNQVAAAGIQSLATTDEMAARYALGKYGEHLTDEDQGHLSGFIDTMKSARAADSAAQGVEQARQARIASDTQAHDWMTQLSDPQTGDVNFPTNWLRDMVADPRVVPETKAALWQAHDRLLRQGDPAQSDPATLVSLINQMTLPNNGGLTPTDVWQHAGGNLSLADTQMLAGAAFPKTPQQRAEVAAVAGTIATARDIIASPENGPAGQAAFGRFVNWLMPAYRNAGNGSLNPNSDNWILGGENGTPGMIQAFMPRGDDLLVGPIRQMNTANTADRPSLGAIFGGEPMPNASRYPGMRNPMVQG